MSIIILDDFLDPNDLIKFQEYVKAKHTSQKIIEDPDWASAFWERYGERLSQAHPEWKGVYPCVTVTHTSTPIARHVDKQRFNEQYKILIYLNNVPNGGTIFYLKEGPQTVQNKANRLVGFDMHISHESERFHPSLKKMAIGFRVQS